MKNKQNRQSMNGMTSPSNIKPQNQRRISYDSVKESEFFTQDINTNKQYNSQSKSKFNAQTNIFIDSKNQGFEDELLEMNSQSLHPGQSKLSNSQNMTLRQNSDQQSKQQDRIDERLDTNDIFIQESQSFQIKQSYAFQPKKTNSIQIKDQSMAHSSASNFTPQITQQNKKSSFSSKNSLKTLQKIAQIKRKLWYFYKNFTSSGRRQYLNNPQIRQVISDKSDIIQVDQSVLCLRMIVVCFKSTLGKVDDQIQKYVGLFSPHSKLKFMLLLFTTIVNVIFFIGFSIIVIFHESSPQEIKIYTKISIFWILDILLYLNTKIYLKSNLICDRSQIFKAYLKKRALYDFIAFAFITIQSDNLYQNKFFMIISFIKLKNIFQDVDQIQQYLCMSVKNYYLVQLVNLILKVFIIGHIISCIWYLIGQLELYVLGYDTTWYQQGISGGDTVWWILYLEALFWSLTLMTTGSNVATTLPQMIFTTFIMIFTTILFGYLMNVTGIIICQLDKKSENKRLDLNVINDYMRQYKISTDLQLRVNHDIQNFYKNNMDESLREKQQVLLKISPTLQNLVKLEYCYQILDKVKIIREKFSQELVSDLCDVLEEEYFLPNQSVYSSSTQNINNICLMFIAKGSIQFSKTILDHHTTPMDLYTLKKGQILGEYNFFTGQCYEQNAISCEFTKIVKINRDKFYQIVQKREKDLQIFCQIRDQLMIYGKFEVINRQCIFCQNSTHLESDCHLIHIQKDGLFQKMKLLEIKDQGRNAYKRKKITNKTLKNSVKIKTQIQEFQNLFQPILQQNQVDSRDNSDQNTDSSLSFMDDQYESDEQIDSIQKHLHNNKQLSHHKNDRFEDIQQNPHKPILKQFLSYTLSKKLIEDDDEQLNQKPIIKENNHHNNNPNHHHNGSIIELTDEDDNNSNKQKAIPHSKKQLNFDQQNPINEQQNPIKEYNLWKKKKLTLLKRIGTGINQLEKQNSINFANDNLLQLSNNKKNKLDRVYSKTHDENSIKRRGNIFINNTNTQQKLQRKMVKHLTQLNNQNNSNGDINVHSSQLIEEETKKAVNLFDMSFDMLQDWKFYLPSGNSKNVFQRYIKYQKKIFRLRLKKKGTK